MSPFWVVLPIVLVASMLWAWFYYAPSSRDNPPARLLSSAAYFGIIGLILIGLVISNGIDAWSIPQRALILLGMPAGILLGRLILPKR